MVALRPCWAARFTPGCSLPANLPALDHDSTQAVLAGASSSREGTLCCQAVFTLLDTLQASVQCCIM